HSTVTFNDTSSCRFLASDSFKRLLGTVIVSGPTDVQVTRQEREGGPLLRLSHDGYADRYGVIHQRSLRLSSDGRRLDGEDVFVPARGDQLSARVKDQFAV